MVGKFLILLLAVTANSFNPSTPLNPLFTDPGETHESITKFIFNKAAIGPDSLFEETKRETSLTPSNINARLEIVDANIEVESNEVDVREAHFHNGAIEEGHKRIVQNFYSIVAYLNANDVSNARKELGKALHALQDFYSYSNWIELNINAKVSPESIPLHPLFGKRKPDGTAENLQIGFTDIKICPLGPLDEVLETFSAVKKLSTVGDLANLPKNLNQLGDHVKDYVEVTSCILENTCPDCNLNIWVPGSSDFGSLQAYRGEINKCTRGCTSSPHFEYHDIAVRLASEASTQFLKDLNAVVPREQMRLLFGFGAAVGFAIDTTISMAAIIAGVKAAVIKILDDLKNTMDEPSQYVLSEINDPDTGLVSLRTSRILFEDDLGDLFLHGGGFDCPEYAMTGTLRAVQSLSPGGNLIIITGASIKAVDKPQAQAVIGLAKRKRIKIFPFIFTSQCGDDSSDPIYSQIAAATGGQASFRVPASQAGILTSKLRGQIHPNTDWIIRARWDDVSFSKLWGKVVDFSELVTDPEDKGKSELKDLMNSIKEGILGGTRKAKRATEDHYRSLSGESFLSISSPLSGLWGVILLVEGPGSFALYGPTSLHVSRFDFLEYQYYEVHGGYFPTGCDPVSGDWQLFGAEVYGDIVTAKFSLRTLDGELVMDLPASIDTVDGLDGTPGKNRLFGNFTVPNQEFAIYFNAVDSAGRAVVRVLPGAVSVDAVPQSSTTTTISTTSTSSTTSSGSTIRTTSSISTSSTSSTSSTPATTPLALEQRSHRVL
ncbi:hypothetical protein ABW19_dt0201498 [Dactylella cylindrospora]|nr:hypothetical protein ABW19_dt0201498 [Dactylella cylindrospora]